MSPSRPPIPPSQRIARIVVVLLLLLTALVATLPALPVATPPQAQAAIVNNPPGQSYGSLVDCLQPGANGLYATTCFGSKWTAGAYGSGADDYDAPTTDAAVVTFYDAKPDQSNSNPGEDSTHIYPASLGQVGSVYGLAYRSQSGELFTSAYLKRITRFGPGGPAAIYKLDPISAATAQQVITVPGAAAGIPDNSTRSGHDTAVIDSIGKLGLGDLAISPDETRLLVVDLTNRGLHQFQATAPYAETSFVTLPAATAGCPGGANDFRPFGVTERYNGQNQIFVSFVCSGFTNQSWSDVRVGALMSTDGAANWSRVAFTTINQQHNDPKISATNEERWTYWHGGDTTCQAPYHCPQPMASSIDFTYDGKMVLGLRDRYGDMTLSFNDKGGTIGISAGDTILLDPSGTNSWGSVHLASDGNEYLKDDNTQPGTVDYEHILGASVVVPGLHTGGVGQEIVSTINDAYQDFTGNITWFNYGVPTPSQVDRAANEEIYLSSKANFGKAAGLGDLVILCSYAQIGDRVWIDSNNNGVQDAGEANVPGVVLQVTQNGKNIQVTTDSSGLWSVYIDPFQPATVQVISGLPSGYTYTTQNSGSNDATDSDANAAGTIAVPVLGHNQVIDLTYDIGLVQPANVRITKSAPATVVRGSSIAYTLTYANDGPNSAQNTMVVDTLPTGVSYVSASPAPSSISGQTLTWTFGALAAGASGSITVNVSTNASTPTSVTNTAVISTSTPGDTPGDNTGTATTVILSPNVYVQKSGPSTVTAGDVYNYSLVIGNNGDAPAANTVVNDTLPAGLTFIAAVPPPTTINGQTLSWNFNTMNAGYAGTIAVQVQVAPTTASGTVLVNTATIGTTIPGDNPPDNASSVPTTVYQADVFVTKSSPNTFPVRSGDPVTYYLDYGNNGPAAAQNVVLNDPVPPQLTNVAWSCTSGCSGSGSGNAVSLNLGTLAAGAGGRVTVTGNAVTSLAREDFTNTATMTTSTPETRTDNNTSTVPGAVNTSDLQIIKLADAYVGVGGVFTATLSYRNNGPATAPQVQLVDVLPKDISLVSATRGGVDFPPTSIVTQTLTWNLGDLADHISGTITLRLRASSTMQTPTTVVNHTVIKDTPPTGQPSTDRDPTNNQSDAPTTVTKPDLVVRKDDGKTVVGPGDTLTYTIVASNVGPITATGVLLTETPPPGVTIVSTDWTAAGNGTWTQPVGTLGAGKTVTRTFALTLPNPYTATTVLNTVHVNDDGTYGPDPTPDNNTATDTDTVQSGRVGDRIWLDTNRDGVQDPGETGIPYITVELIDPRTGIVIATTETGDDGIYSFDGLALNQPYAVQIAQTSLNDAPLNGYIFTTPTVPSATIDPSHPVDLTLDIGVAPPQTTAVVLRYLRAERLTDGSVRVRWSTISEHNTAHFHLARSVSRNQATAIELDTRIDSQGSAGGDYQLPDPTAPGDDPLYYWLVETERDGTLVWYGPVTLRVVGGTTTSPVLYLPVVKQEER